MASPLSCKVSSSVNHSAARLSWLHTHLVFRCFTIINEIFSHHLIRCIFFPLYPPCLYFSLFIHVWSDWSGGKKKRKSSWHHFSCEVCNHPKHNSSVTTSSPSSPSVLYVRFSLRIGNFLHWKKKLWWKFEGIVPMETGILSMHQWSGKWSENQSCNNNSA